MILTAHFALARRYFICNSSYCWSLMHSVSFTPMHRALRYPHVNHRACQMLLTLQPFKLLRRSGRQQQQSEQTHAMCLNVLQANSTNSWVLTRDLPQREHAPLQRFITANVTCVTMGTTFQELRKRVALSARLYLEGLQRH
jgi:hypothetical protein